MPGEAEVLKAPAGGPVPSGKVVTDLSFDDQPDGGLKVKGLIEKSTEIAGRPLPKDVWTVRPALDGDKLGKILFKREEENLDYYMFLLNDRPMMNAEVSVRVNTIKGKATPYVGVIMRYRSPTDFYLLRYRPKTNNLELQRTINTVRDPVKRIELQPPNTMGQWHTIRMRLVGQRFSCYLDDKLAYEVTDATFRTPGLVGIWASGDAEAWFDDLEITDLGSENPLAAESPLADGFSVEDVDKSTDAGKVSSLAIDAQGRKHVAYWDPSKRQLLYIQQDHGIWGTPEVVARAGQELPENLDFGIHPSIAVGKDGVPRIAFAHDRRYGTIILATRTDKGWNKENIDGGRIIAFLPSLALDQEDNPHVIYQDVMNYLVKYATRKDGKWTVRQVERVEVMAVNAPLYNAIKVDSKGTPHLVYNVLALNALRHTTWDGKQWIIETVDAKGQPFTVGLGAGLALGPQDQPHISHEESAFGQAKYSFRDGDNWTNTVVDGGQAVSDLTQPTPPDSVGTFIQIAVDGADRPHLLYFDSTTGTLRYAVKNGADWAITDTGAQGWSCSLAIGPDPENPKENRPYATFFDGMKRHLRLLKMPPIAEGKS